MNLQNLIDYCNMNNMPSPLAGVITPAPIDPNIVKSYIMMRCGLLTPVYNEPDLFRESTRVWFAARSWEFEHLVAVLEAKYSPIENVDKYEEWTKETTGDYKNAESGTDRTVKDASNTESGTDRTVKDATNAESGKDTVVKDATEAESGEDSIVKDATTVLSGTDTETTTRATENTISAFNTSGYQADNKSEDSGDLSTTYGKQEDLDDTTTTTYGHSVDTDDTTTTTYGHKVDIDDNTSTTYGHKVDIDDDTATTYGHTVNNNHYDKETYTNHLHGNYGMTSNEQLINEEIDLLERFNVYDWIASQFETDMFVCVY